MTDFHLVWHVLSNLSVMIVEVEQEVSWGADLQGTERNGLGLLDVVDRHPFAFGDDVLAKGEFPAVESRLHLVHHIIYGAFAEKSYEQPGEEAGQPSSLARFRDVAFAAMFPLPNLGGNEKPVEEEKHPMLQPFEPFLPGNLVEGEDIDIDALVHLDMAEG